MPEATPGAWEIVVDSCYQAPYMTNGPYWVSYDDPDSLTLKVCTVHSPHLVEISIGAYMNIL